MLIMWPRRRRVPHRLYLLYQPSAGACPCVCLCACANASTSTCLIQQGQVCSSSIAPSRGASQPACISASGASLADCNNSTQDVTRVTRAAEDQGACRHRPRRMAKGACVRRSLHATMADQCRAAGMGPCHKVCRAAPTAPGLLGSVLASGCNTLLSTLDWRLTAHLPAFLLVLQADGCAEAA
jgi:hypothetical protein